MKLAMTVPLFKFHPSIQLPLSVHLQPLHQVLVLSKPESGGK